MLEVQELVEEAREGGLDAREKRRDLGVVEDEQGNEKIRASVFELDLVDGVLDAERQQDSDSDVIVVEPVGTERDAPGGLVSSEYSEVLAGLGDFFGVVSELRSETDSLSNISGVEVGEKRFPDEVAHHEVSDSRGVFVFESPRD